MAYLKVGNWSIHANGLRGTLCIHEIDGLGRVFGRVCAIPPAAARAAPATGGRSRACAAVSRNRSAATHSVNAAGEVRCSE
jgi:hypothetical protein